VKKLELLTCRAHFRDRSHFGYLGFKTFERSFEALNDDFGGQKFLEIDCSLLTLLYSVKDFQWHGNHIIQIKFMFPTSWLIFFITIVLNGFHVSFHYSHMWN
jgi:hypothetical protein